MARRSPLSRPVRSLRAALVVLVAAGYVVALGTTAAGEGLALVPHLALDHVGTLAPPVLVDASPEADEVLTTLRPHAHGDATHSHEPPRRTAWPTIQVDAPHDAEGWHSHGDETHRHAPAPSAPDALVVVSLDKHRLPASPAVPAAPVTVVAWQMQETMVASVAPSVETPPPVGRG